jgi:hypothetical protein
VAHAVRYRTRRGLIVIPAEAGIQVVPIDAAACDPGSRTKTWITACAGMTEWDQDVLYGSRHE